MDDNRELQTSHGQQHAQITSSYAPAPMRPAKTGPATLLDLPNEVLLTIAAYVPFENGKSIVTLRLVNHQLRDLLVDGSNLQQLRNDSAALRYGIANSLRMETGDHTWKSVGGLEVDHREVSEIMRHIFAPGNDPSDCHPHHGNEEELLTLGLHLFTVIARLDPQSLSEVHRSLYVLLFSLPIISVPRFTSLRITEMLGKHLSFGTSLHLQTEFPSAVPLAVEDHMLAYGLTLPRILFTVDPEAEGSNPVAVHILEQIQNGAEAIAETVSYVTAQTAWAESRRRPDHTTRWIGKVKMHRDDRIPWAVVANNSLMDQICKSEVFPGTANLAESMQSLHEYCFGGDSEQPKTAITEDDKAREAMRFMDMIDRLAEVDGYEVVEKNISLLTSKAPRTAGADGLLNAIVSHFQGALRLVPCLREATLDDLEDSEVLLPHFGYLFVKEYVEKVFHLMGGRWCW